MIIGFTGLAGSGKSTLVGMINEILRDPAPELAFAAPLRQFFLSCVGAPKSRDQVPYNLTLEPDLKKKTVYEVLGDFAVGDCIDKACTYRVSEEQKQELRDYLFPNGALNTEITIRQALQFVGTDWGRKHWPTIWIDSSKRALDQAREMYDNVFFTDCRFPNEAQMIKDQGGVIIEVKGGKSQEGDSHISEKPLPRAMLDTEVLNYGTLQQLESKAKAIADYYKLRRR